MTKNWFYGHKKIAYYFYGHKIQVMGCSAASRVMNSMRENVMNKAQKIVDVAVNELRMALIEERDDFIDENEARKIYEQQDRIIKELEKIHGGRQWMYECFKVEKLVIGEGITRDGVRGFVATDENTGVIVSARPSMDSLLRDLDLRKKSYEKKIGRPAELEGGKAIKVYLDAQSIAIAQRLGNGNTSEGIRKALKQAEFR